MNSYFSRLAQRSSVSAAVPHKQPRTTSASMANDAWSEQSLEITTPGNSQAQPHHFADNNSKTATELSSSGSQGITPASETPANNRGSTTLSSESNAAEITQASTSPATTTSPKTLYSHSHLQVSLDDLPARIGMPENPSSKSDSDLHTVSQASAISTNDDIYAESSASTSTEYTPRIKSFSHVQADAHSVVESVKNNKTTSVLESVESFDELPVQKSQQIRAKATQYLGVIDASRQSERVASNPVQAAESLQAIRTTSHSSVQVNIGKIELEVFAPLAKPTPAPPTQQPAKAKPSPGPRSAAFNPHRHYLRGR